MSAGARSDESRGVFIAAASRITLAASKQVPQARLPARADFHIVVLQRTLNAIVPTGEDRGKRREKRADKAKNT
jgi:hypothetical protein